MSMISQQASTKVARSLIVGTLLVTIFIMTNADDPFNAPKFWMLMVFAAWILGQIVVQGKEALLASKHRVLLLISGIFVAANLVAGFATDNIFVGFFGEYQRRTGALTYLALTFFLIGAALFFSHASYQLFSWVVVGVGSFFAFYGSIQTSHHDPLHWNNPYNSILLTLGNPDFASAIMAIIAVLLLGLALNESFSRVFRAYSLFISAYLLVLIYSTKAIQGLLAFGVGFALLVIVRAGQISKVLSRTGVGLVVVVGPLAVFGMLAHGPLSFLHKQSVTLRGNYFRAAWKMFTSNPFLGVGLDRYGANFRSSRDLRQVLMNGPMVMSNNAHDVPLQLLATGGLLVFLGYLSLVVFIGYRGFIGIKNSSGSQQIAIAGITGAWITYQAQSLISIDNIGISVWGWLLGGIVIALSYLDPEIKEAVTPGKKKKAKQSTENKSLVASMTSSAIVLPVLILSISMYLAESSMQKGLSTQRPSDQKLFSLYQQVLEKPLGYFPTDPTMRVKIAANVATVNAAEAERILAINIASDKKDYEARSTLALIYEGTNQPAKALPVREEMVLMDPFNYVNALATAKTAEKVGDASAAKKYAALVLKYAPAGQDRTDAQAILAK